MRSKEAFAYSKGTGYFCSVAAPFRRVTPRRAGAGHDATARVMTMREPPTLRAGRGLPQRPPSPQRAMADTYPYGATYLRVDYAKCRFGYPYVGSYYGSYYAPRYYYDYRSPYYW